LYSLQTVTFLGDSATVPVTSGSVPNSGRYHLLIFLYCITVQELYFLPIISPH